MNSDLRVKAIKHGGSMHPFFSEILPAEPGIYIVGGSVRDLLLGRSPMDCDIVVEGDPMILARKLAIKTSGHVVQLGAPGKRITRVTSGSAVFEIALVAGQTIEDDLLRRDFTINAMAYETASNQIIDPTEGRKDLVEKTVRMVSEHAFMEDPVRLIRTFRIAAVLNFKIDSQTLNAVKFHAKRMIASPGERIRPELLKILETANAYPYLLQMADTGLLQTVFPEMEPMKECSQNHRHIYDVFHHTLDAYKKLEDLLTHPESLIPQNLIDAAFHHIERPLLKLAILLHDIGKPCTRTEDSKGTIHFYGHEKTGAAMFRHIARRLTLSNKEADYVNRIIENHLRPLHLFTASRRHPLSRRNRVRFFMRFPDLCPALLVHAVADARAKTIPDASQPFAEFAAGLLNDFFLQFKPESEKPPLITGRDLILELGLTPSPLFKKILLAVEESRLVQRSLTREQALQLAKNLSNGISEPY